MPVTKKHFTLSPLNDNPVNISAGGVISGGFTHKDGYPTLKWSIPSQNAWLETSSLHLTGQILIKKSDGTLFEAVPNVTDETLNVAASSEVTQIKTSNWGGVKNVIDKVVLHSKKSLIELTSAINYSQYEALLECYSNNDEDYKQSPLNRGLSGGRKAEFTQIKTSRAVNQAAMGNIDGYNDKYVGQFFSIRINTDLMNTIPLDLSDNFLGGLLLDIHLNPDSHYFNRLNRVTDVAQQPESHAADNVSYVLKNVRLEGRYIIPNEADLKAYKTNIMLNSRLNLINDVQSSINSNSYTPQLQMVKSFVNTFLDNDQTNNVIHNCNNMRRVVGEEGNQQAKNGLRFPFDYKVEMIPSRKSENLAPSNPFPFTPNIATVPATMYGDVETRKQFERALLGGVEPYHSSADLELQNASLLEDYDLTAAGVSGAKNNMKSNVVGIGADFTFGMGGVQNFVDQDYNLTIDSGVNSGASDLPPARNGSTISNPLLQQTFVRHLGQFNLQTLVKTM
tara:strand:- start:2602 stop:4122 length:1521 start_codon:yes stop_codon:yes gene_type:complete